MSYAQVQGESLAVADALGGLGGELGDRLVVDLPNWPEWVVAFLAAAYRGAVLVPLDPSLSFHELKYQLRHADVRAGVVAEERSEERRVGKEWRGRWGEGQRGKEWVRQTRAVR